MDVKKKREELNLERKLLYEKYNKLCVKADRMSKVKRDVARKEALTCYKIELEKVYNSYGIIFGKQKHKFPNLGRNWLPQE